MKSICKLMVFALGLAVIAVALTTIVNRLFDDEYYCCDDFDF